MSFISTHFVFYFQTGELTVNPEATCVQLNNNTDDQGYQFKYLYFVH